MLDFISFVIAIIFSVTIHEFSHAWMATRLGDPTPRIYGRLSLNPLRHFDLFGTLSLILFHIGWGKPVPFNPENLKHPKRDSALIGLAGPLSNLLVAFIFAIPLKYLNDTGFHTLPLYGLMSAIFEVSVVLFALNILPLPPFDGSKIIGIFVPRRFQHLYEAYLTNGVTYVILFILFDVFVLSEILGFSVLQFVVVKISNFLIALISLGT